MREVLDIRKKAKIAIAALLVVDIAAVVLLFSPLVGSERSRREQLDQLWQELQRKTHEAEPLKDVDKKIAVASQQIDDFYKTRLPAQDSAIYEELGKVAKQNGVRIGQIRSKAEGHRPGRPAPGGDPGGFLRRLSATGAFHQRAGARSRCFSLLTAWNWVASRRA